MLRPIGLAAAIGLVCYFAVAIASHFRSSDQAHVAMPIAYWLLALGVAVLHLIALL